MPMMVSLFFIAIVALVTVLHVPAQEQRMVTAVSDSRATSMLAYRASVIDYMNSNPSFVGTVPDASMTFPWGYTRDPRWSNVVESGGLYVYDASASGDRGILDELYRKTANFMVGRNFSGTLISARGFASGVTVSATVPNGAIVIVGK